MDFHKGQQIRIAYLDFEDLISKRTFNPLAEAELPQMLRDALESGGAVIVTNPEGHDVGRFMIDKNGQFHYVPLQRG